jgi:hypothetical protein
MEKKEAIKKLLDLVGSDDPELMHSKADKILLEVIDKEIAEAYTKVVKSASWWACA